MVLVRYPAVWVFAAALAVRLTVVLTLPDLVEESSDKKYRYDPVGLSIAAGKGVRFGETPAAVAPAYPALLGAVYFTCGYSLTAVRCVLSVLDALHCVAYYFIARRVAFGAVPLLTAGALTLSPYSIICIYWGTTETLFLLLHALFVWSCLSALDRGTSGAFFGSGALLGLSALCRAVTLLLPVVVLLALWLRPEFTRRRALTLFAASLLGFSAVVGPWIGRNYLIFSRFIPIQTLGGLHLYLATGEAPTELPEVSGIDSDGTLYRLALQRIAERPGQFALTMLDRLIGVWYASHSGTHAPVLMVVNFSLLAMAACGALLLRRQWRNLALLYLTVLYYVALHSVMLGIFRYMLQTVPILLILASVPAALVFERLGIARAAVRSIGIGEASTRTP